MKNKRWQEIEQLYNNQERVLGLMEIWEGPDFRPDRTFGTSFF